MLRRGLLCSFGQWCQSYSDLCFSSLSLLRHKTKRCYDVSTLTPPRDINTKLDEALIWWFSILNIQKHYPDILGEIRVEISSSSCPSHSSSTRIPPTSDLRSQRLDQEDTAANANASTPDIAQQFIQDPSIPFLLLHIDLLTLQYLP